MALTARLATLFCLSTALGFAATWSGWLVDSKCYGSLERNKNPSDTLTYVDRDRGQEVRYCHATPKTTAFAVVDESGQSFDFDSSGNAKAAQLVHDAGRKSIGRVALTGEIAAGRIKVDSISAAR